MLGDKFVDRADFLSILKSKGGSTGAESAAFALADSPLKKKREAYLLKIEMELKEEGMLNKVGEDFAGLTKEEAAAQIESIKLGGVEVSIEGEETRKTKKMPDRLAKRLEEDPRKPPAYWENRLSNGTP